jgi:inhibitor of KinA sporulation pathway (predicted exonuclease)
VKKYCVAVVFDLEYTAWEGSLARSWSGDSEDPEIIQIGAIELLLENNSLCLGREFNRFVRPTLRPQLSGYITELTKISQETVDQKGLPFDEALREFFGFVPKSASICSNGDDWSFLSENCRINNLVNPFKKSKFVNLRPVFAKHRGLPEDSEMLHSYRLSASRQTTAQTRANLGHDALVDAKAIAAQMIRIGVSKLPFGSK